jgi:triosephosphate isomerase
MARKPIVVGNWKMNKTIAETKAFVAAVDDKLNDKADWGIATPYLDLPAAKEAKYLIVAAEDMHF